MQFTPSANSETTALPFATNSSHAFEIARPIRVDLGRPERRSLQVSLLHHSSSKAPHCVPEHLIPSPSSLTRVQKNTNWLAFGLAVSLLTV